MKKKKAKEVRATFVGSREVGGGKQSSEYSYKYTVIQVVDEFVMYIGWTIKGS